MEQRSNDHKAPGWLIFNKNTMPETDLIKMVSWILQEEVQDVLFSANYAEICLSDTVHIKWSHGQCQKIIIGQVWRTDRTMWSPDKKVRILLSIHQAINLYQILCDLLFHTEKHGKSLFLAFEIESDIMTSSLKPLSVQQFVRIFHLGVQIVGGMITCGPSLSFRQPCEKSLLVCKIFGKSLEYRIKQTFDRISKKLCQTFR